MVANPFMTMIHVMDYTSNKVYNPNQKTVLNDTHPKSHVILNVNVIRFILFN